MLTRLIRTTALVVVVFAGFASLQASGDELRHAVLQRAQVWRPTQIAAMNLATGPRGAGAFAPGALVRCVYVDRKMSGNTPKFTCRLASGEEVKVKYGGNNGEVYGELLTTRLLWALGFGADRMYRVNVICDRCPEEFGGIAEPDGTSRFAPALIERKFDAREWGEEGKGWAWPELDQVDSAAGGAPARQRDALKLIAVLLQHTDTKAPQQRIVCLGAGKTKECARPFLLIQDVGRTFGRATRSNSRT